MMVNYKATVCGLLNTTQAVESISKLTEAK